MKQYHEEGCYSWLSMRQWPHHLHHHRFMTLQVEKSDGLINVIKGVAINQQIIDSQCGREHLVSSSKAWSIIFYSSTSLQFFHDFVSIIIFKAVAIIKRDCILMSKHFIWLISFCRKFLDSLPSWKSFQECSTKHKPIGSSIDFVFSIANLIVYIVI